MLKDRTTVWILEYFLGVVLISLPMLGLYLGGKNLPDAHIWTLELFIICLGVVLISSASSMRQRIILVKRIERLEQKIAEKTGTSKVSAVN